jgi:hypothetical protein
MNNVDGGRTTNSRFAEDGIAWLNNYSHEAALAEQEYLEEEIVITPEDVGKALGIGKKEKDMGTFFSERMN